MKAAARGTFPSGRPARKRRGPTSRERGGLLSYQGGSVRRRETPRPIPPGGKDPSQHRSGQSRSPAATRRRAGRRRAEGPIPAARATLRPHGPPERAPSPRTPCGQAPSPPSTRQGLPPRPAPAASCGSAGGATAPPVRIRRRRARASVSGPARRSLPGGMPGRTVRRRSGTGFRGTGRFFARA